MYRLLTSLSCLIFGVSVCAADITHRVIISDGESVPGVPAETFQSFSNWTITSDGKVVFVGRLSASRRGIWIEISPGQVEKVTFVGDEIAGDGRFLTGNNGELAIASNNKVAFTWSTVNDQGGDVRDELFVWDNGQIQRIAAVGETTPISGTAYAQVSNLTVNANGQLAFEALLSGAGVSSSNNEAVFLYDGLQTVTVARKGQQLGGFTTSGFEEFALSNSGDVFFIANSSDADRREAIYKFSPTGGLSLIVADKSPPTGTDEFFCCNELVINRVGQVSTSATYRQQDDYFTGGLLLIRGGSGGVSELYMEKRTPENLPLDGEISFIGFRFLMDDFGNFWTQGQKANTGEVYVTRFNGGTFKQFLLNGAPAPGTPYNLVGSNLYSTNGAGQVTVLSTIDDGANTDALYVIQGETPELVFKEGDQITIGTEPPQAVQVIVPGVGNPANGRRGGISLDGTLVWSAFTENARRAIMVSEVGPPPLPSIDLEGLEVTQGIQNLNNDIPLYTGKETYVRAYLNSSVGQPANLVLRAYDAALSELPGSPIRPVSGLAEAGPQPDPDRNNTSTNPVFRLPPEWTEEILVTLEADRLNGGLNCQEDDGASGDCAVDIGFADQPVIPIRFVSLGYKKGGVQQAVTRARTRELAQDLLIGMPTTGIDWSYGRISTGLTSRPGSPRGRGLVGMLRILERCFTSQGCKRHYYGVILSDGEDGIADLPGKTGSGWSPANRLKIGRHTHTHELGHNFLRPHSVDSSFGNASGGRKKGLCGSVAASSSPDFPNYQTVGGRLRPLLSRLDTPARQHYYGFDPVTRRVADPRTVYDTMSYCSQPVFDLWTSDYTYRQLIPAIDAAHSSPPPDFVLDPGPNEDYFLINGAVNLESGSIIIEAPQLLPDSQVPDDMPGGSYTARLLGTGDQVLDFKTFEPQLAEARGNSVSLAVFNLAFVYDPAAVAVEVDDNNGIVQRLDASDNGPVVQVVSPNGGESLSSEMVNLSWTASDADGDDLSFAVLYSPDTIDWRVLALNLNDTTLQIPRSLLPGGGNATLRVIVSDGFNTAYDDNDTPFEVVDNPPAVLIANPFEDQVYLPGAVIELDAEVIDPEGGLLDASTLSWSSDLDGALGTAQSLQLSADSLTAGRHVLTASISDPVTSEPGTASVSIDILSAVPANTADLELTISDISPVEDPASRRLLLSIKNLGGDTAVNLRAGVIQTSASLQSVVRASWQIVSSSGLNCSGDDGISCILASLAAGESAEVTFDVTSYGPGFYQFDAQTSHGGLDPWPLNNGSSFGVGLEAASFYVFKNSFEQ